jgi:hypothetical protein
MFSVLALWLSAYVGDFISKRVLPRRDDFGVILTASLTSFAMAVSRYDR